MLNAALLSPIRATCPAHLILPDFITPIIFGEDYRTCSASSFMVYLTMLSTTDKGASNDDLAVSNELERTWKATAMIWPPAGPPTAFSGTGENIFFGPSQQGRTGEGKSKETNQRASYARWPLAASTVKRTNHYLIISDVTEKDKNICSIFGPGLGPLSGPPVICTGPPPTPSALTRRLWYFSGGTR
jgi:hypothetical protein